MPHFELVTVRVQDSDGAEGLGYTYAVNSGGAAFRCSIDRYLAPVRRRARPRPRPSRSGQDMWWAVHYAGPRRARHLGHLGGRHRAVGPAGPPRRAAAVAVLRRLRPAVPVYAGGIDLEFPIEALLEQADRLPKRGLPRDQDEGRPRRLARGRRAGAADARAPRRRLPADGRRQHEVDRRPGDPRRPCADDFDLVWLEEPTIPDDVAGHARVLRDGGLPVASGREPAHALRVQAR